MLFSDSPLSLATFTVMTGFRVTVPVLLRTQLSFEAPLSYCLLFLATTCPIGTNIYTARLHLFYEVVQSQKFYPWLLRYEAAPKRLIELQALEDGILAFFYTIKSCLPRPQLTRFFCVL